MAVIRIIIACVYVLASVTGEYAAAPPAFSNAGGNGNGAGKNCRFEFTVPDKAGMCSSGNSGLESKIDKVKEDLDRTRLQSVSQNTIFQDQLSKVQNNVNGYGSQVNDLYNHIRQIQSQMSNLPSSNGPGSNDLQKLVQTTKDTFNKAFHDMENRLFNISYNFQKDAIEQSKVNAAVEMQVRLQEQRTQETEEKIRDLLKMVMNLQKNPGTSSGTSNTSPGIPNDVRNRLKHFDEQIQMYDQMQQQQFSTLNLKSNELALKLSNHSHELNDMAVESKALMYRVDDAAKKAEKVTMDMDDFKNTNVPKISSLEKAMSEVKAQTKDLDKKLTDVAGKAMNADIHSSTDATDISDLKIRITLLTTRIKGVLEQLSNQSTTIEDLSKSLNSLSSTLNPKQLQAMQAALTSLHNTGTIGSVTQTQLHQIETEIANLENIVTALQKHAPPALVVPTSPHQQTTTQPFVVPTTKQPFVVPTTKLPFVVPTMQKAPTTKLPFIVPTPKKVPTTKQPFVVPTVKKVPTTKLPFIVPTPKKVPTTKQPFVVPTPKKVPTTKQPFVVPTPRLGRVTIAPKSPPFLNPSFPGGSK